MPQSAIFPTLDALVRHHRKNPIQLPGKPPVFLRHIVADRGYSYRQLLRAVQLLARHGLRSRPLPTLPVAAAHDVDEMQAIHSAARAAAAVGTAAHSQPHALRRAANSDAETAGAATAATATAAGRAAGRRVVMAEPLYEQIGPDAGRSQRPTEPSEYELQAAGAPQVNPLYEPLHEGDGEEGARTEGATRSCIFLVQFGSV